MLYEFQCQKCKEITERIVRMGTDKIKCPECGEIAKKIMSASAIIMKGYSAANGYSDAPKTNKGSKKNPVS